jgi:ABC-type multidrug transport system fused ATPase/permease subunit
VAEPVLRVDNLVVRYGGRRGSGTTVIDDVSFELKAGETLSLVGESGSGKTTIGRAILGLAPVTAGSITFRDRPISNIPRGRRRTVARAIQVVFQDPYSSLNPAMRVEDILVEPLAAAGISGGRQRVRKLLDAVGLPSDAGRRYPREFSGGQRQRIAIARAILKNPSVLILDEATSNLDTESERLIEDALGKLLVGRTTLIIAHRLSTVRRADRLLVLDRGRIVEEGSHAELLSQGGLYARLYQRQFRDEPVGLEI